MTLEPDQLTALLDVIHQADTAIMKIYTAKTATVLEHKSEDNSPLTQADLASHDILTNGIAKLFPDIPIVSEEGDQTANKRVVQTDHFWLVDPLDGTKEFLARTGEFCICVGLIEHGRPTFGIISAPVLDVTYYGGPGQGSYKISGQGQSVEMHVTKKRTGVVFGSRQDPNSQTNVYIAKHYPGFEIKKLGAQLKLPQIAEGLADAYPRINGPLHLWDLAAGQAILEAAGGKVTRPDGTAISYNNPNLMVGDFIASS